jgi:hypothetical protein
MANNDIFRVMINNFSKLRSAVMNRAAESTVSAVKSELGKNYNLKRKDLSDKIKLTKASKDRDYANINVRHEPMGLIYFGARQIRQGVSYSINKGTRSLRKSAFIVNVSSSGKQQVFQRYGAKVRISKGRYTGQMRQRIKKQAGPSIAQFFLGRKWTSISSFIQNTFVTKFQSEFTRLKDRFTDGSGGLD